MSTINQDSSPARQAHSLLWILPSFTWLLFFIFLPLVFVFLLSLTRREPTGEIEWALGVSNYVRAFDKLYAVIYFRSLFLAGACTLLCLILAFPLAYFIALQKSASVKNVWLFLVTLPFWTSFLVRTYAWIIILRTEGLINKGLMECGLIHEPLNLLYNNFAILIGLVYGELPFMILPLYTVLEKIEKSLLEASSDLGSSPSQTFYRVILPLCHSGISAGVILVFIPSLGAFITPDLLGGAKSMMVGNLIQSQFTIVRDQPFGSAIAFLLTAAVLVLLALSYKTARRSAEVKIL